METLGISAHNWFRAVYTSGTARPKQVGFDELFDEFMTGLETSLIPSGRYIRFSIGTVQYTVVADPAIDTSAIGPNQVSCAKRLN